MAASVDDSRTCVVLRVKRKRDKDPAEALVVSKRTKLDSTEKGTSVFQFVGTLGEEESSDRVILDKLKHYSDRRNQVKSNPLAQLSLEDRKRRAREAVVSQASAQRFKVTSRLRCLENAGSSHSQSGITGEERRPLLVQERVHLCDVMQEEESGEQGSAELQAGVVTCNDMVMVREKVVPKPKDYVYDLYFTKEVGTIDMETATFDWSSLSVYEPELVHDIIDSEEEVYEDEDDSNDESNWRNDYPDEEESPHSSESEGDRDDYRHWEADYDDYQLEDYQ